MAVKALPVTRAARRSVAYREILVPLVPTETSEQAMSIACQLAADRHATVTALTVIEVPPTLPLDADMVDDEARAKRLLAEARAIADSYGVAIAIRVVRARGAGEAIVEEAGAVGAEIVVVRAPRKRRLGRTVRFVLVHAPCRVLVVVTGPPA
jgi:APA family basic amino acid/polyamine antiporter